MLVVVYIKNIEYLLSGHHHDLALVKLGPPLDKTDWNWESTENDAIYPICLPDTSYREYRKEGKNLLVCLLPSVVTFFKESERSPCRVEAEGGYLSLPLTVVSLRGVGLGWGGWFTWWRFRVCYGGIRVVLRLPG